MPPVNSRPIIFTEDGLVLEENGDIFSGIPVNEVKQIIDAIRNGSRTVNIDGTPAGFIKGRELNCPKTRDEYLEHIKECKCHATNER